MSKVSDTVFRNAKPKEAEYTIYDDKGLRLMIKPNGKKIWQFIYTSPETKKRRKKILDFYIEKREVVKIGEDGKEYKETVTSGLSLDGARGKAIELKAMIKDNICPIENEIRENQKRLEISKINNQKDIINQTTFKKVSLDWLESYKSEVSENYHTKISRALELYTYPFIGNTPITEIKRLDLISIITDLKNKDLKETARRTLQLINSVFMYAVTMELVPHNIVADIDKKTVLGKKEISNYPSLTKEDDIKGLLLAIDNYKGDVVTQKAMKILPYVFVRSFNLRHMEWSEIDLIKKEWTIPKEKMKMKKDFILPLPHQVITILEDMKQISQNEKYVFPSFRLNKPLSDNTFITALRRMGYTKEELVPHSFRSIFSTIANENSHLHKHSHDVIEALLAHNEKNQVRGAYNRAEYTKQMRELIQWYADYLDSLKGGK